MTLEGAPCPNLLYSWLVGYLAGCWLVIWLFVWLTGWLVSWFAGWLVDYLVILRKAQQEKDEKIAAFRIKGITHAAYRRSTALRL